MLRRVWCAIVICICFGSVAAWAVNVDINIEVKNGKVVSGGGVVKLTRGDHVSFSVVSDKADELHVHGYDLHLKIIPNQPAKLEFDASRTGRFSAELHHSDTQLVVLEIYPK